MTLFGFTREKDMGFFIGFVSSWLPLACVDNVYPGFDWGALRSFFCWCFDWY